MRFAVAASLLMLSLPLAAAPCNTQKPGQKAEVLITLDANGVPVADPVDCHVQGGTTVVYKADKDVKFAVKFNADTPDKKNGKDFPSRRALFSNWRKASFEAKDATGDFKYDISVDGKVLDPKIIIDPPLRNGDAAPVQEEAEAEADL